MTVTPDREVEIARLEPVKLEQAVREFSDGCTPDWFDETTWPDQHLREIADGALAVRASISEETYLYYAAIAGGLTDPARLILRYFLCIYALELLASEGDERRRRLQYVLDPDVRDCYRLLSGFDTSAAPPAAENEFNRLTADTRADAQRLLNVDQERLRLHAAALMESDVWKSSETRITELLEVIEGSAEKGAFLANLLKSILFDLAAEARFAYFGGRVALATEIVEHADSIVRDPELQTELQEHYPILKGQTIQAKPPRFGTTSFLLVCKDGDRKPTAAKCVFPRYWATAIGITTEERRCQNMVYKDILPDKVPGISEADNKAIVMEFLSGETVGEKRRLLWAKIRAADKDARFKWLQRDPDPASAPLPPPIREAVSTCVQGICRLLADLASKPSPPPVTDPKEPCCGFDPDKVDRYHLDLSSDNVILGTEGDAAETGWSEPALIDFGVNYLLREALVSGDRVERARVFIAPELRASDYNKSHLCDVYSIGVVGLEIASADPITGDDLPERLETLWQRGPFLAEVVEDLIDADPRNRLTDGKAPRADAAAAHGWIGQQMSRAADAQEHATPTPPRGPLAAVWHLLAMLREPPPELDRDRGWLRLKDLSLQRVYTILWTLTLALGVAILLARWHWLKHVREATPGTEFLVRHKEGNDFFWSQLVAVSTSLIAYTYYSYIFASFEATASWPAGTRAARWTARLGPLVAMVLQIGALLYPLPLAVPAGVGGLLIALNNHLWLQITDRARELARVNKLSTVGTYLDKFRKEFAPWWILMGAYSIGGIAIGSLLWVDYAHDTFIYALTLAIGVNLFPLYYFKVCREAVSVRAALKRSLFLLRRDYESSRETASGTEPV